MTPEEARNHMRVLVTLQKISWTGCIGVRTSCGNCSEELMIIVVFSASSNGSLIIMANVYTFTAAFFAPDSP